MWYHNPETGVRVFIVDYPERVWGAAPPSPEQIKSLEELNKKVRAWIKEKGIKIVINGKIVEDGSFDQKGDVPEVL